MKITPLLKFVTGFVCSLLLIVMAGRAIGQPAVTKATLTAILEGNQVFIQEKQAKLRDIAKNNQQVRTGMTRAELTFDNKAVARLSKNTRFTVGQCGVQLQAGTVLVSGTSACTRGVTAAVRGTTYVLKVNEDGTEEYQVLEGSVDFAKTAAEDPHKWAMDGGDKCILFPDRKGVVRGKLSRGEFTRRLRGWAFRGFETDENRYDRLRTTYTKLFPGTRFPLQRKLNPNRGNFILSIKQDQPRLKEVIARISWQRRRNEIYLPERFVGDFVFPINQKAMFIRGIEPFHRFSIRLFDRENRFLGYTEFEGLDDNASVSVILPDDPKFYGQVRTVFGEDTDRNGVIDSDAFTYDFVSLVKTKDKDQKKIEVIFPEKLEDIDRSVLVASQIPAMGDTPEFPDTFYEPLFSPLDRSTFPFRDGLEPPLLTIPGQVNPLVPVKPDGSSVFEVPKEILKYRSKRLISGALTHSLAHTIGLRRDYTGASLGG